MNQTQVINLRGDLGLDISINNILYGNLDFEYDVSCTLFAAVHRCIMDTKIFFYCLLTPNSSDGNDSTSIPIQVIIDNESDTSYKLTRSSPLHINH
jgi:hypothetical protein